MIIIQYVLNEINTKCYFYFYFCFLRYLGPPILNWDFLPGYVDDMSNECKRFIERMFDKILKKCIEWNEIKDSNYIIEVSCLRWVLAINNKWNKIKWYNSYSLLGSRLFYLPFLYNLLSLSVLDIEDDFYAFHNGIRLNKVKV